MKFIERFKTFANREDNNGLRMLLDEIANDPDTFSCHFNGFGSCSKKQDLFFFYSEGEAAIILADTCGCPDELADEEKFNDELPLWFSESSHRLSPFTQVRTLVTYFMEVMNNLKDSEVCNCLSVLVTNINIINYDDYAEVFENLNGAVFHNFKDLQSYISVIPCSSANVKGQTLFNQFLDYSLSWERFQSLFSPFKVYLGSSQNENNSDTTTSAPIPIINASDFFSEKELDDFFSLEDPDFRSTEEVTNANTGERITVKKDTELPPVNILEPLGDPQHFLDEMVGLEELKKNISEIIAYARYSERVKAAFPNCSLQPLNLHTIITGNPGTGKTTMCRIYGGLLHQAGVLSRGHTVVASRGSFIGQQFGTEELRMRQCLKLAQGGCLFIDEAAQLFTNPHPHDPGKGVIQLMLQLLSDEQNRDIAVVLALYDNDKSLDRLYALNPGIKSRFVNLLSFPDYSFPELLKIARKRMRAQGLSFTPKAWQSFCRILKNIYDNRGKDYANAREVVNLLQRCVVKHAVRCDKQNIKGDGLLRLTIRDIPDFVPVKAHKGIGYI